MQSMYLSLHEKNTLKYSVNKGLIGGLSVGNCVVAFILDIQLDPPPPSHKIVVSLSIQTGCTKKQ
jgi:hypothetical protein